MFIASLDTCTPWPSLRRDFLLSLAIEGLYRPVWSEDTLGELGWCEREKLIRRGIPPQQAQTTADRLVATMRSAFEDALILDAVTAAVAPFGLPDPDDEHVLAAAFVAGAQVIVTEDRTDFPARLLPHGIDVIDPAEFARNTVSVEPSRAMVAVETMALRRSATPVGTILDVLEARYQMGEAVDMLRELL